MKNLRSKEQIEKRISLHIKKIMELHETNLESTVKEEEWTLNRLEQIKLKDQLSILLWVLGDDCIYGNPLHKIKDPERPTNPSTKPDMLC